MGVNVVGVNVVGVASSDALESLDHAVVVGVVWTKAELEVWLLGRVCGCDGCFLMADLGGYIGQI